MVNFRKFLSTIFVISLISSCGKKREAKKEENIFEGKKSEIGVYVVNVGKQKNFSAYVIFSGIVQSEKASQISSKVSGRIVKLYVDIGDRVKEGQLLAKIDDKDYRNAVERAKFDLERIKSQLELAKINFERAEKLIQTKSIPQAEYDSAKSNYESLKASYELAQKALEKAQIDLAETNIFSPYDGIVVEKRADVGTVVSPQIPILILQSTKTYFLGKISEQDLTKIKIGMKAEIDFPSIKRTVEGKITSIKPTADTSRSGFEVIVELKERVPQNLQGIAKVKLDIEKEIENGKLQKNIVVVPYESIYISSDGEFVFGVSDGRAKKIKVNIIENLQDFALVEIPEKITQIISPITDRIFDGIKVKIIGERALKIVSDYFPKTEYFTFHNFFAHSLSCHHRNFFSRESFEGYFAIFYVSYTYF
ncbi:Multidrug resistance protein MdtA [bacterium HR19]|nr:Multidrug resistance protein MdtA [bacterium HR19]